MGTYDEKPLVDTVPVLTIVDSNLSVPEKAALPKLTTTVYTTPTRGSARSSADFTPRTDKTENPFDTDLEAMVPSNESTPPGCVRREITNKSDCQVWPGRNDWKAKAKAAKARRGWTCLGGLSTRNRIIAKILIVLLIIGVAVGVGFGVSKPLGAPIWGDHN